MIHSGAHPLRVGIVGCGALGAVHAKQFSQIPDVEVIALADPSRENLDRAASPLPRPPMIRTENYEELLQARPDVVCIATPDGLHVQQLLLALEAGAHVLCEKPLTPYPEELRRVLAARDAAGKRVSLTYPRRYSGGIRAMRREIQSGRWGKPRTVTAYNAEDWVTPNRGTWRHDPEMCPGGFFYDAAGHQIDTVLWATGLEGEWVKASADLRGCNVPLVVWGTAFLSGGVPFTFSFVGDARRWREQVNIHCDRRDFALENGRAFWDGDRGMQPVEPADPDESCEVAFVRLVREGGTNWAPPDEVWPVLCFTRAALDSAAEHRGVAVSRG